MYRMEVKIFEIRKEWLECSDESVQITAKLEHNKYDILFYHFREEFSPEYFLSSSIRKRGEFYLLKIQIKRTYGFYDAKIAHAFHITLNMEDDKDLIQYFKKHHRNIPIRIERKHTDTFVQFYLIIANTLHIGFKKTALSQCDICYGENVEGYENSLFMCGHKSFCVDCCTTLARMNSNCPFCRSDPKYYLNAI